jgi:hypothetical protein
LSDVNYLIIGVEGPVFFPAQSRSTLSSRRPRTKGRRRLKNSSWPTTNTCPFKTAMDLTVYLEQVVRNVSRDYTCTLGSDIRQ